MEGFELFIFSLWNTDNRISCWVQVHFLVKLKNEFQGQEGKQKQSLLSTEKFPATGRGPERVAGVYMCPANILLVTSKNSTLVASTHFKMQGSHLVLLSSTFSPGLGSFVSAVCYAYLALVM